LAGESSLEGRDKKYLNLKLKNYFFIFNNRIESGWNERMEIGNIISREQLNLHLVAAGIFKSLKSFGN